jgi:voltage-dependent anion channel protein 2
MNERRSSFLTCSINGFFFAPLAILVDDYTTSVVLKAKKMAGDVLVNIETERTDNGELKTKLGSKFAYAKFNVDKGQLNHDGGKILETSLALSPEVKMFFKAGKTTDLGVELVQGNFYGTAQVDVLDMSRIATTACVGLQPGVKVGGSTAYSLQGGKRFQGFNVGVSYTNGPFFGSLQANQNSQFNIGLMYQVNRDLTVASITTHSAERACEVLALGGTYKAPAGLVKAKFSSNGVLSACLIR